MNQTPLDLANRIISRNEDPEMVTVARHMIELNSALAATNDYKYMACTCRVPEVCGMCKFTIETVLLATKALRYTNENVYSESKIGPHNGRMCNCRRYPCKILIDHGEHHDPQFGYIVRCDCGLQTQEVTSRYAAELRWDAGIHK